MVNAAEDVDPEVRQRLAALGYVGSFVATANDPRSDRADPKDKIDLFNLMGTARDLGREEGGFEKAVGMLNQVVKADPNVDRFMSSVGGRGGTAGNNAGILFMHLKPRKDRVLSADEVAEQLRTKLALVPGIRAFVQNPPTISFGGRSTKSQYQLTLPSPDTDELYRVSPILETRMRELEGLVDVTSDLQLKNPQVSLQIDRDKAASLGITAQAIEDAFYTHRAYSC